MPNIKVSEEHYKCMRCGGDVHLTYTLHFSADFAAPPRIGKTPHVECDKCGATFRETGYGLDYDYGVHFLRPLKPWEDGYIAQTAPGKE